jgi:putative membrane protein (TIGR04086 family)
MLAFSMIMAAILLRSNDPTGRLGLLSFVVLIFSAAVGGFATAKLNPTKKLRFSLTVALSACVIMMLIALISTKGHLSVASFMNYLCYLGVFSLFAQLGGRSKKKNRRKRRM